MTSAQPPWEITYDPEARALYCSVGVHANVWKTQETPHGVNVDLAPDGRVVGFEILNFDPSSPLPDSETEWGTRDRHGRVHTVGVENEAQARSMRSMTPVRREVGPWIEVTS